MTRDYTGYFEGWKKRQAKTEAQRQARYQEALATAEKIGQTLRQRWNADNAYLFGSCLAKERFRMDSDIDIAAVGLDSAKFFRIWAEIERETDFEIDLVAWEDAPPSLRERIKTEGREIGR
jgi:predicted nucleotidyltransferase